MHVRLNDQLAIVQLFVAGVIPRSCLELVTNFNVGCNRNSKFSVLGEKETFKDTHP